MRKNVLDNLAQIRSQLVGEGAYEVDSPDNSPGQGEVGDGADEIMDEFIADVADAVMDACGCEPEKALDIILSIVDDLIEGGDLPDMPEPGDSQADAEWVAAAKTAGLPEQAVEAAEAEAAE